MQLTHLGPYQIEKPLGKGGMGSVYAATDPQTGQPVAIKALSPHLAMAEGFRERFEAEIESLKTLRHEGIVRLYGYGEQDGVLFYSMELVKGTSLEDELRAGRRFNWREVTNIAIQLALALKHAHDHGIVHRDIKPANILLYDDDRVKLADFGIARLFGMTQLTTAGGVLGTADYMSPEQAEGRPVTARCDQYSLGCVMYALLAGRPPFTANNLPQMLQLQRFADPEPVRRYAPDAPEQLETLIKQLLSKEPANRFPNTQVLARHLQAMVRALSRPAADDFALTGEGGSPGTAIDRNGGDLEGSVSMEPTQLETPATQRPSNGATAPRAAATHDAPTLAAEDAPPSHAEAAPSNSAGSGAKKPVSRRLENFAAPTIERTSRFTTVEEDEAQRKAEQQRPWLLLAAQLAALVAVLAGIVGAVMYLSRPATADELYRTISAEAEHQDGRKLENVAKEVDEFLALYPQDPRARELERYKERIELDKLERKLQRLEGGNIDTSLLPVERLYLQAIGMATTAPKAGIGTLQSLVDLYGPGAGADKDRRTGEIVQLAKRRIAVLQKDLAKQQEQQLESLRERLKAASDLATRNPQEAAAMYRAVVALYEKDTWAADVVAEARQRLTEIEPK